MKLPFAAHLKALRREKNLTQEQLAQKLDVSVQSVSRWETEQTYPDIELLPVIAAFFETTVDRLIGTESAALEEKRDAYIDQWNRTPGWQERHKLLLKAHHDFPRDMHISTLLCDSYTYPDNMKNEPDALEKARVLALDVLETTAREHDPNNWWYREGVIRCMVDAETDDRVEEWLNKYASHQDMRRDALLLSRYGTRHNGSCSASGWVFSGCIWFWIALHMGRMFPHGSGIMKPCCGSSICSPVRKGKIRFPETVFPICGRSSG